jgi:peptide/nickel transport system ATP-binding protein
MSETLLEVKDLIVQYKTDLETSVRKTASRFVSKSESLGVVGETGAGKTTTALTISAMPETPGVVERVHHV